MRHLLLPSSKRLVPATTRPCRLGTSHGSVRARACQVRPKSDSRATPTCTGHRLTGPPGKAHTSPCRGSTATRQDPGLSPASAERSKGSSLPLGKCADVADWGIVWSDPLEDGCNETALTLFLPSLSKAEGRREILHVAESLAPLT
jgi:hypothetical protein